MKTGLEGHRLARRYLLERLIATGGMGTIWRGTDETLDRPVAVKILHEHLAKDPALFDRFRFEAVAAARLSHPAVVRIFDTGVDDGICYIVMELLEARPLSEVMADRGALPHGEAVRIAMRVLQALGHAHAAGIVHRDIKPANVLVGTDVVKVGDFGIAKAAFAGDLTTTGTLLGTAKYLSPEQVEGREVDGRSDLYATGIMLYEMLTGRVPFEASTELATAMLRLTDVPQPPRSMRAAIPRGVDSIVLRAIDREPAARFASADEMAAALARFADGPDEPAVGHRSEPPASVSDGGSFFRSWMLAPLLILLLAGAGVTAGLIMGRLEFGGPIGIRPRSGAEAAAGPVLSFAGVADHDPEGDRTEHPERVALAWDSRASTFWETEGYSSADLGGGKPGVGLLVDLGRSREVTAVEVRSPLPGWRFEMRASDGTGVLGRALREIDGGRSFVAEKRTLIALRPARTRYVLVWITELVPAGGRYRARIAEIRLKGAARD